MKKKMKEKAMSFNKRIFSILLEQAKGDRSWRQFAIDCDISYIQMRKLALQQQEHSPRKKLITKIAQNAAGGITAEDLFFCSRGEEEREGKSSAVQARSGELFHEKFQSLSMGQRKMVLDFIDFLLSR
jgi:hypothetical protein